MQLQALEGVGPFQMVKRRHQNISEESAWRRSNALQAQIKRRVLHIDAYFPLISANMYHRSHAALPPQWGSQGGMGRSKTPHPTLSAWLGRRELGAVLFLSFFLCSFLWASGFQRDPVGTNSYSLQWHETTFNVAVGKLEDVYDSKVSLLYHRCSLGVTWETNRMLTEARSAALTCEKLLRSCAQCCRYICPSIKVNLWFHQTFRSRLGCQDLDVQMDNPRSMSSASLEQQSTLLFLTASQVSKRPITLDLPD